MFTGLIEDVGIVQRVDKAGDGMLITIESNKVIDNIRIGDSIAIDGVCLTVTAFDKNSFKVFASKITYKLTSISNYKNGRRVNLERALLVTSRLGGHLVQGHVDGMGRVVKIDRDENGIRIKISVKTEILKYLVGKGSIAVDGVSLTVVNIEDDGFVIYVIPETIAGTTLGRLSPGDNVNVEADIIAKYVEKMLNAGIEGDKTSDEVLKSKLREEGFMP